MQKTLQHRAKVEIEVTQWAIGLFLSAGVMIAIVDQVGWKGLVIVWFACGATANVFVAFIVDSEDINLKSSRAMSDSIGIGPAIFIVQGVLTPVTGLYMMLAYSGVADYEA